MTEVKCPNCQSWTPKDEGVCNNCKNDLTKSFEKERDEMISKPSAGLPLIEISEDDPPLMRLGKRGVRMAQLIFFSVISIIAGMASSTVH